MVITLRRVVPINQNAQPVSRLQQEEVVCPPDAMLEGVYTSVATTQSQGHLPLQEHPDGVECEMTTMATIVETIQETAITGISNCTFGDAPSFVFRSSTKSSQHRPLTSACRHGGTLVLGQPWRRRRRIHIPRSIVGCKRKCGFFGNNGTSRATEGTCCIPPRSSGQLLPGI